MLQRITKVNKIAFLQYLLIYLIFISSRACLYDANKDFFVYLMLGICLLLTVTYRYLINAKLYIVFVLLLSSMLVTRFVNSGGLGISYFLILLSTVLTAYIAYKIDTRFFLERYLRLTCFFAVVSLVCWALAFISPSFLDSMLITKTDYFDGTKGVLFYSFQYSSWMEGYHRNNGIFTEPGIYQIVLNSAIYILLFMDKQLSFSPKIKNRFLIIFLVTVITTQSTTGYISLAAILMGYFIINLNQINKKIPRILILAGIVLGVNYLMAGEESIVYKTIIEKMTNTSTGSLDLSASTGYYRVNKLSMCWEIFKKYPFGCGDKFTGLVQVMANGESGSGAGILYFMATTGIITMIILCYVTVWLAWKNINKVVPYLVYLIMWINTGFSQAEVVYGCILVLAFIKHADDTESQESHGITKRRVT